MTFLGIISFVDPIKKTSFAAIKEARMLEVEIKILTGDSPEVARAVATKIGLISTPQEVITGEKFAALELEMRKKLPVKHVTFLLVYLLIRNMKL